MPSWSMVKGESYEQYECFRVYLRVRSLVKVAREMNKSTSGISGTAKEFDWKQRAADYDSWRGRIEAEVEKEELIDLKKEHLSLLRLARSVAKENLCRLLDEGVELTPRDVLAYFKEVIQLERLVTGEASDRKEISVDYSTLSDDELRDLSEIAKKLK